MIFSGDAQVRRIYLDVPHSENPETVLVRRIGRPLRRRHAGGRHHRNERQTYLDNFRTPHTEKLHVVERWQADRRRQDARSHFRSKIRTPFTSRGPRSSGSGASSGRCTKKPAPRTTRPCSTITCRWPTSRTLIPFTGYSPRTTTSEEETMGTQQVFSRRHMLAMSAAAEVLPSAALSRRRGAGGQADRAARSGARPDHLHLGADRRSRHQPRRHRQCRRTAVVEGGRLSAVSRHGPQAVEICARAGNIGLQGEYQCRQRDHPRSAGPAGGLRGGDAPGRAGGTRRQHHRDGEQLSGPPSQLSERYRGEIRWRDLFHRSLDRPCAVKPPGETDLTFAGVYRVSPDRGTLTLLVDDFLDPERHRVLAGRECALHQRLARAAISAPSICRRTARSPARPTGFLPIWADPSPACPTA